MVERGWAVTFLRGDLGVQHMQQRLHRLLTLLQQMTGLRDMLVGLFCVACCKRRKAVYNGADARLYHVYCACSVSCVLEGISPRRAIDPA